MTPRQVFIGVWFAVLASAVAACSDSGAGAGGPSCTSLCGGTSVCTDGNAESEEGCSSTANPACESTCTYLRDQPPGTCNEEIDGWMTCASDADWSCSGDGCADGCASLEQAAYGCIAENGGEGGSGGVTGSDACAQASQLFASECPGMPIPTFGVCDQVNLCRASCVTATLCDLQAQASCMVACTGGEGGYGGEAGTGGDAGYGGDAGTGGYAGYAGEPGTGGYAGYAGEPGTGGSTGTDIYPGCFSYAATYCGCLGEYAAPDCAANIADGCDTMYDLCPSETVTYIACINAQSCQSGWTENCPFDCGG